MRPVMLFDLTHTLIFPYPSVGAIYARAGRAFGLNATPEALDRAFLAAYRELRKAPGAPDFETQKSWWRELVERVFDQVLFQGPRAACFDRLFEAFAHGEAWRLYDDVLPALTALHTKGFRLGILSNFDRRAHQILSELQLTPYFETILTSEDLGVAKPDPQAFLRAAQHFGVEPKAVQYVGNDPELDRDAAESAGMRAVLMDRTTQATGTLPSLEALMP